MLIDRDGGRDIGDGNFPLRLAAFVTGERPGGRRRVHLRRRRGEDLRGVRHRIDGLLPLGDALPVPDDQFGLENGEAFLGPPDGLPGAGVVVDPGLRRCPHGGSLGGRSRVEEGPFVAGRPVETGGCVFAAQHRPVVEVNAKITETQVHQDFTDSVDHFCFSE